jgi:3-oxoadipate enol-lactonase/4-carboxymuconolactone decarboxylase
MAILAADALALADALEWRHFALLGHSMGGFVAQLMAVAAPDRLDALVLMDTGHGPIEGLDPAEVDLAVAVVNDVGIDGLADLLAERESPLETPANKRLVAEREGYAEFGDRKFRATSPYLYGSIVREFVNQDDRLEALTGLSAALPALVIVGEQDTPFIGAAKRMSDAIAGASLAVIADAGHCPQFENPEGWWAPLSAFLTSVV